MRFLPKSLVIHRLCPLGKSEEQVLIGKSRDGKLIHLAKPETVKAFKHMNEAARLSGVELHVIWAFRDVSLQREQFEDAKRRHGPRNGIKWLAPPVFSEHQTGWVLDIGDLGDPEADDNPLFTRTKAYAWLSQHAGEYGFELSFKPNNWQGVSFEPWHWRFVGTPEAHAAFHPHGWQFLLVWVKSFAEAMRWWMHP